MRLGKTAGNIGILADSDARIQVSTCMYIFAWAAICLTYPYSRNSCLFGCLTQEFCAHSIGGCADPPPHSGGARTPPKTRAKKKTFLLLFLSSCAKRRCAYDKNTFLKIRILKNVFLPFWHRARPPPPPPPTLCIYCFSSVAFATSRLVSMWGTHIAFTKCARRENIHTGGYLKSPPFIPPLFRRA